MKLIKRDRMLVLGLLFALLLLIYLIALYKLQIVEGAAYYEASQNNITITSNVTGTRGDILDRYGRVLVTNKTTYNLTINSGELFAEDSDIDPNEAILKLVQMVKDAGCEYNDELPITTAPPFEYNSLTSIDEARLNAYKEQNDLDENASAVEVLSNMRDRYDISGNYTAEEARIIAGVRYAVNVRYLINTSEYIFVEDADIRLITSIKESNVKGISVNESYVRSYNTDYASHLLGYVNWMSDAQYEHYMDKGYSAGTKVGQDGVEEAFEEYLHGSDGTVEITTSSEGKEINRVYTQEPSPGNHVYLTIDIVLQEATERALRNGIEGLQANVVETPGVDSEITGGAAVVVDVKTGEPLAIASYPTYDVSSILEHYSEILEADNTPLFNRALQGTYAPGSIFKPCTAIAALTEGKLSTATRIKCNGIFTDYLDQGYAPQCWIYSQDGLTHGADDVTEALRDSCNYFFYTVGRDLGIDSMGKYAKLFGLGQPTGIELNEQTGNMSARDTHMQWVGEEWSIGDTLQAAIGQSDSIFTPLQLAEYCAAIANCGHRHSASLLKEVRSYDYSTKLFERSEKEISTVESKDYNWAAVHKGMNMVATEWSGSGYKTFKDYTASTVCCKTGTAQKGESVTNDGTFICFAPYENPEIAIAVVVERAGAGANCAPIAREILELYFSMKTATSETEIEGQLLK